MKTTELVKTINDSINEAKNKYQFINILVNGLDEGVKDIVLKSLIRKKNIVQLDELKSFIEELSIKNRDAELQKIDEQIKELELLKSKLKV